MRKVLIVLSVLAISVITGCSNSRGPKLFTVDFKEGQSLRYKFTSSRETTIQWDSKDTTSKPTQKTTSTHQEEMKMVILYTPVEVDPYGLTKIKATCESIKVKRFSKRYKKGLDKDAVNSLAGKSFTFTLTSAGNIKDYSEMEKLIKATGDKAFRPERDQGRIKEPDMIGDFIVSQWFLWDSISSIKNPTEGVKVGDSWKSVLSVPGPMVMKKAREVEYTLNKINKEQRAVIKSRYQYSESAEKNWPTPYSGTFRLSGTFGTLVGYKILDLQGEGEEWFNMNKGRIEKSNQQYEVKLSASSIFPIGNLSPQITMKQNLTMELIED